MANYFNNQSTDLVIFSVKISNSSLHIFSSLLQPWTCHSTMLQSICFLHLYVIVVYIVDTFCPIEVKNKTLKKLDTRYIKEEESTEGEER